jgi:hypothetical protein
MPLKIPSDFLLYGLKAHGDELAAVTIQHSDKGDGTQVMRSEVQIYRTSTGELLNSYFAGFKYFVCSGRFPRWGSVHFRRKR